MALVAVLTAAVGSAIVAVPAALADPAPVITGNALQTFTPPVGTAAMDVMLAGAAGGGSDGGAGAVAEEYVAWNDPSSPPTFVVGTSAAPTGSQPVAETGVTYGGPNDAFAPGSAGGSGASSGDAGGNPSFLAVVPPSGDEGSTGTPTVLLSDGVLADVVLAAAGGGGGGGDGAYFGVSGLPGGADTTTYNGGNGGSCIAEPTAGESVVNGDGSFAGGSASSVEGPGDSAETEVVDGVYDVQYAGGGGGGGGGLSTSSPVGGTLYSGLSGGAGATDNSASIGSGGAGAGGGGGAAGDGYDPSTFSVGSTVLTMLPTSTTYPGDALNSTSATPPDCVGQNATDGNATISYLNGIGQSQALISQGATAASGDATFSVSLVDASGGLLGSGYEPWFYYTVLEGTCSANQAFLAAGGVNFSTGPQPTILAQNDVSGTGTNPFTFSAPVDQPICLVPYADTSVPAGTVRGVPIYANEPQTVPNQIGVSLRWGPTDFSPSEPSTATVTVTVSGLESYGSSTPSFTYTDDAPSGVALSGTLTCSTEGGGTSLSGLGVGSYTLDGASCSGLSAPSGYSVSYVGAQNDFTVNAVTVTVNVSGSESYGSSSPSFTYTDDAPSGVALSGTLTCSTEGGGTSLSGLGVGSYTLDGASCSGLSAPSGYSVSYVGVASGFTVKAATITVRASGSETYGIWSPSFTYTDDAPSEVTLSGTLRCTTVNGGLPLTNLGPGLYVEGTFYSSDWSLDGSSCSGLKASDSTDYVLSYVGGNFVVNRAPLTVTASSGTMTYGGAVPSITPSYSGFVNGDFSGSLLSRPTCSTTATSASPSGSYPTTCSGATSSDYIISYVPGTVTVEPATITVSVSGSESYGSSSPSFTYTDDAPSGVALSGTLTCTSEGGGTSLSGLGVGSYTLDGASCSGLDPSDSTDYVVAYVGVSTAFTVSPAPLSISASSPSFTYGGVAPVITPSYSGFVNGDDASSLTTQPTCTTPATSSSNVGSYASSCSGASDPNYTISYLGGSVTVDPAALTVSAPSPSSIFGQPLPTLTPSYSGFVNGDTSASLSSQASCQTTATASSAPGSYAVTCSGAADLNYTVSYVGGTLTIEKITPSITWRTPRPITYGTALCAPAAYGRSPFFSSDFDHFLGFGDDGARFVPRGGRCQLDATASVRGTFSYRPGAGAVLPAGTETLSVTFVPTNAVDYASVEKTVTLVVLPAPLEVTASSGEMTVGSTPPVVTPGYRGFVDGDTAASLSTAPTCSTTATSQSSPGVYRSACSGGVDPNYTISYRSGIILVTPAIPRGLATLSIRRYPTFRGLRPPSAP